MKQPVIKFSHHYPKLGVLAGTNDEARLLDAHPVQLELLSPDFLDYDTAIDGGGYYKLPRKGRYLMLIFARPDNVGLFTTLRRWTPEKERYYREMTGQRFKVEYMTPTPDIMGEKCEECGGFTAPNALASVRCSCTV